MTERLLAGLALALALGACTVPEAAKVDTEEEKKKAEQANLPPARIDLPPLIKLEGSIPPATHPDGLTMRVEGLLARYRKFVGKKIIVKGYLVEKYECPEEATKCERNNASLHDTAGGGEKKLLLVGFPDAVRDALKVGELYTVTGSFERKSDDGFIQSNGLLIYESIEGLEVEDEGEKKKGRR